MTADIKNIGVQTIAGADTSLGEFEGDVLMVVNVASACGLTPQYETLEQVYETYKDRGLKVLGFPANNFAGQEPGSNEEIAEFCTTKFDVQFPMFSKISVNGDDRHPLYDALVAAQPTRTENPEGDLRGMLDKNGLGPLSETDVMWNFEKFLVGRDGTVIGRFAPDLAPDDPAVIAAIEAAL